MTEPYLRLIFIFFSKKRTMGFAIKESKYPTTNGEKYTINFGNTTAIMNTINAANNKLQIIFKYLVEVFNYYLTPYASNNPARRISVYASKNGPTPFASSFTIGSDI